MRPATLNACWRSLWPECVPNSNRAGIQITSADIIRLAQHISAGGFNELTENDIDEILEDTPIADDDIIAIISSGDKNNKDDDNNDEVKAEPAPLTATSIREGLEFAKKLEN